MNTNNVWRFWKLIFVAYVFFLLWFVVVKPIGFIDRIQSILENRSSPSSFMMRATVFSDTSATFLLLAFLAAAAKRIDRILFSLIQRYRVLSDTPNSRATCATVAHRQEIQGDDEHKHLIDASERINTTIFNLI